MGVVLVAVYFLILLVITFFLLACTRIHRDADDEPPDSLSVPRSERAPSAAQSSRKPSAVPTSTQTDSSRKSSIAPPEPRKPSAAAPEPRKSSIAAEPDVPEPSHKSPGHRKSSSHRASSAARVPGAPDEYSSEGETWDLDTSHIAPEPASRQSSAAGSLSDRADSETDDSSAPPGSAGDEGFVRGEEYALEVLSPTATAQEQQRHEWNVRVRRISVAVREISNDRLKPVNFCYLDRLCHIRGKRRAIPNNVRPVSASLSRVGVYIYDTTKIKDNHLYLIIGPESPPNLRPYGNQLLERMAAETPQATIERVEDMSGPAFMRVLRVMGGHTKMMPKARNMEDELMFEMRFFRELFRVYTFVGGKSAELEATVQSLSMDLLPEKGSAVIDMGDDMLYFYIADIASEDDDDVKDRINAVVWMNQQQDYAKKNVLICDANTLPPNLALLLAPNG
jgi:hypothetical protein